MGRALREGPFTSPPQLLPRDSILPQYIVVSLRRSVCSSHAGNVSKRLDGLTRFWHGGFLPPILHSVLRTFGYLQNEGYFPLELCPSSERRKFRHGTIVLSTKRIDGSACGIAELLV